MAEDIIALPIHGIKTCKFYIRYVDTDNQSHWLFDSFLFLEIMDTGTGGANKMFAKGYNLESANQADWTKLIDYYFQSETGIGALDASVKEASAILGTPRQKRQIVISIPEPIVYQHPEQASSSTSIGGKLITRRLTFPTLPTELKPANGISIRYVPSSMKRTINM